MASVKSNKTGEFKPPEPKWFTLEKIAERWTQQSGQSVSVDDLLLYAVQNGLEIGVEAESWHMRHYNQQDPTADPTTSVKNGYVALPFDVVNEFRFIEERLVKHIESADKSILTYVDTPSWSRQASEELSNTLPRAKDYENGIPKFYTPKIHKNELIITLEERDRFEKQYGIGTLAGEIPSIASEETEKRRLERALGALVLGLANKGGSWGSANNPNISSIVSCALAVVQNETGDTPNGYGKTTLTDTINAAIKACQRELKR
ncbi:MAG: hypothetical protein B7X29_00100 [Halothiobacillus sp. 13-55-115]|jgi:hypothetical protein|nr:MAG: hypothetical protein B7X29_00100 [Halothiobacillus sp. 13-55-115]